MSLEANKALVRHFVDDVLSTGQLDDAEAILAPDFAVHIAGLPEIVGVAAWREAFGGFRAAFPDMRHAIEDLIAEGDRVVMRSTTEGTHQGSLMGLPATGKRVRWVDFFIYRIVDGRLAEEWGQMDMLGLLQQLGAVPALGGAPA